MSEDFYVGYLPKMPKSVAKIVRFFVISVFAVAVGVTILLWFGQKPFADSYFEFTETKQFTGYIQAEPIPFLLVEQSEKNNGLPMFERFPLVAEGKFGIDVSVFKNQFVSVKGKLIYRDDLKMIEVAANSIFRQETKNSAPAETAESLGVQTLNGEIVDSKCYLGVMNPGQSKPHKECAIRCLSGGIPPLFIVKDTAANVSELWIMADKSKFLDYVAEPVEISGEVKRQGDKLLIYLNSIKRL
jgi:hypothetical protein